MLFLGCCVLQRTPECWWDKCIQHLATQKLGKSVTVTFTMPSCCS